MHDYVQWEDHSIEETPVGRRNVWAVWCGVLIVGVVIVSCEISPGEEHVVNLANIVQSGLDRGMSQVGFRPGFRPGRDYAQQQGTYRPQRIHWQGHKAAMRIYSTQQNEVAKDKSSPEVPGLMQYSLTGQALKPCIPEGQKPTGLKRDDFCGWGDQPFEFGVHQVCVVISELGNSVRCIDAWTWADAVADDPETSSSFGMALQCDQTNFRLRKQFGQIIRYADSKPDSLAPQAKVALERIDELCGPEPSLETPDGISQ